MKAGKAGKAGGGDAPAGGEVKAQVRALLDRLPDDCSYADVQRGIAVLMWPKPAGPVSQDEVRRRLREWLKTETDR